MISKIIQQLTEKGTPDVTPELLRSPFTRFDTIDKYCKEYTQQKWSKLYDDIKSAGSFDDKTTKYLAKRACKVWCLWLELFTKNIIVLSFEEFFKIGLTNDFINPENCSLTVEQRVVFAMFVEMGYISKSLNCNFIEIHNMYKFQSYEIGTPWSGTLRIETEKDHFHSIPIYNLNGSLKISDISYRGYRVNPWNYITQSNFRYFTLFKEVN